MDKMYTNKQCDVCNDEQYSSDLVDSQDYGISIVDNITAGIEWCLDDEHHGDMALAYTCVY